MREITFIKDGRTILVGWITQDSYGAYFLMERGEKEHYFRMFDGYALSKYVLEKELLANNLNRIALRVKETIHSSEVKEVWTTTALEWLKHGIPYEYKGFQDYYKVGDKQLVLPSQFWSITRNPQQRRLE